MDRHDVPKPGISLAQALCEVARTSSFRNRSASSLAACITGNQVGQPISALQRPALCSCSISACSSRDKATCQHLRRLLVLLPFFWGLVPSVTNTT